VLAPEDLYVIELDAPTAAELGAPVMVHSLQGFVDAGAAGRLAGAHLLDVLEHRVVARFDADLLLDYRSRRPPLTFVEDHYADYADPALELYLVRDDGGVPFLFLTGPEPDMHWERFVGAVVQLVERFGVRLSVGLNAIPMAVPHTRPTGVTAHASRRELILDHERWVGTVQVPGHASALLEWRLGRGGHDALGFAVHVPHYVAQAEYPQAAEALLSAVSRATGLSLPVGSLHEQAERVGAEIAAQVAGAEDVAALVRALEEQYDAYVGARGRRSLLEPGADPLPSADELGAELERFLAEQARRDDPER
jgi:predicted ATP-grasp superfamily ATP-dependent carboligase